MKSSYLMSVTSPHQSNTINQPINQSLPLIHPSIFTCIRLVDQSTSWFIPLMLIHLYQLSLLNMASSHILMRSRQSTNSNLTHQPNMMWINQSTKQSVKFSLPHSILCLLRSLACYICADRTSHN